MVRRVDQDTPIIRRTIHAEKKSAYKAGSVTGNDRDRPAEHGAATVAVLVYKACQLGLAYLTSTPLQLARRAEKSERARRMLQ